MNYLRTIALLVAVSVCFSGCAAVVLGGAAAGATYTYIKGWMEKDYPVNLKRAYNASIHAASSHDLRIIEKGIDVTVAYVTAKGAKREVWIKLRRKSRHVTKISVRVGLIGDKEASKIIHNAIADSL